MEAAPRDGAVRRHGEQAPARRRAAVAEPNGQQAAGQRVSGLPLPEVARVAELRQRAAERPVSARQPRALPSYRVVQPLGSEAGRT